MNSGYVQGLSIQSRQKGNGAVSAPELNERANLGLDPFQHFRLIWWRKKSKMTRAFKGWLSEPEIRIMEMLEKYAEKLYSNRQIKLSRGQPC